MDIKLSYMEESGAFTIMGVTEADVVPRVGEKIIWQRKTKTNQTCLHLLKVLDVVYQMHPHGKKKTVADVLVQIEKTDQAERSLKAVNWDKIPLRAN